MAQVTITLTDEEVNGKRNVRLTTAMASAPEDEGKISRAMLVAQWLKMQFASGAVDLDAAFRSLKGQVQLKQAVEKAASGS